MEKIRKPKTKKQEQYKQLSLITALAKLYS